MQSGKSHAGHDRLETQRRDEKADITVAGPEAVNVYSCSNQFYLATSDADTHTYMTSLYQNRFQ